jgi:hypothetical protein
VTAFVPLFVTFVCFVFFVLAAQRP